MKTRTFLLASPTSALMQDPNTVASSPFCTLRLLQVKNYFVGLGLPRTCNRKIRTFHWDVLHVLKGGKGVLTLRKSPRVGDGPVTADREHLGVWGWR